jgi:hypothetical protein
MSSNKFSFNNINNNLTNLKEIFTNLKEEEAKPIDPTKYILSIDVARTNMFNWLSFLCSKLNFSDQTLFRSISLFDQYFSRISPEQAINLDQLNLNLITIACLSLSTKLEEINCNYISFLNEKVLNSPNSKIFTNKDLTQMEFQILKTLKFKTLYSTPLDFLEIYLEIFRNIIVQVNSNIDSQIFSQIKTLSINLMKSNINNIMYLTNTSSNFANLCFIQALNQANMMNSFQFKQLEKSIFTFN